ncbi:MAG: hypothetical protein U7126_03340 [Microcoleus sp.]
MDKTGKIKQEILDRKDDQASRYIQNLKSRASSRSNTICVKSTQDWQLWEMLNLI